MPTAPSGRAIRVALANDYEVVVLGLAQMLAPYSDRIEVVELVVGDTVSEPADITLYDSYAQPQVDASHIEQMLEDERAGRVVVFTWNLQPELREAARRKGLSGYLSKAMSSEDLVAALERVHAGEVVIADSEGDGSIDLQPDEPDAGRWPGQEHGLSVRESEVVALIAVGLSNKEIAARAYLSINSVKSYIRSAYRKMGVSTRSQAVLWAVQHDFLPDHARLGGSGSAGRPAEPVS